MLTVKICRIYKTSSLSQEIAHFENIDKFNQWLNLYIKKFDYIEYTDSKKSQVKLIFNSKLDFEDFYKSNKK